MVDMVLTGGLVLGITAATTIGITLLAIAVGRVKV
jgi:hypothetical protein